MISGCRKVVTRGITVELWNFCFSHENVFRSHWNGINCTNRNVSFKVFGVLKMQMFGHALGCGSNMLIWAMC